MEADYVRNWSVWWDISILLATPLAMLGPDGRVALGETVDRVLPMTFAIVRDLVMFAGFLVAVRMLGVRRRVIGTPARDVR